MEVASAKVSKDSAVSDLTGQEPLGQELPPRTARRRHGPSAEDTAGATELYLQYRPSRVDPDECAGPWPWPCPLRPCLLTQRPSTRTD